MVERGDTALDGSFPVNMSGGVLSSNPIGASGLLRFAEAALQVRGMAGEHQVDGAKVALAQAYGASAQYFAMWVVSSEMKPDVLISGSHLRWRSGATTSVVVARSAREPGLRV